KANALVDLGNTHNLCQEGAMRKRYAEPASGQTFSETEKAYAKEINAALAKSLELMQKKNIDCAEYMLPGELIGQLDMAEKYNGLSKEHFKDLRARTLARIEKLKESTEAGQPIAKAVASLPECQFDKLNVTSIQMEVRAYETQKPGLRYFGTTSPAKCSVQ